MRSIGLAVLALGLAAPLALRADTANVAGDAFVHSGQPNANLGAQSSMTVRIALNGTIQDAYAQFDLSALPPASTVDKAVLRLWVNKVSAPGTIEVLPVLDFTLLHNTGAAFSILAGASGWQRWFFIVLAGVVSVALIVWLWRLPRGHRMIAVALALVTGGAVGNLIDRVRHGYVVDFIHVHWGAAYFPAFNIADSAITIGAALLILDAFMQRS